MRLCVLCGEGLHLEEHSICSLCDPNGNLNYRRITNAGRNRGGIRKQKRNSKEERNREVRNDY